jgi:hypothetical protein
MRQLGKDHGMPAQLPNCQASRVATSENSMEYRTLGRTGIRVSAIAFGCGPVSGWMAELGAEA